MHRFEDLEYVSIAEAKAKLSENIKRADQNGRIFALTKHGEPKAVLISYKRYRALINDSGTPQKIIDIKEWKKETKEKKKVASTVMELFDIGKLKKRGPSYIVKNSHLKKLKNH
jgi:prevent-host-death family protein